MVIRRLSKALSILIIATFTFGSAFAQMMSERPKFRKSDQMFGPSLFTYDTYLFMSAKDSNNCRLDVYVAFANDILQFVKEKQGQFKASYEIFVTVFDKKGNLVGEKSDFNEIVVENFARTNDRNLSNRHTFSFELSPGTYKILVNLTDNDIQKSLIREKRLRIKSFQKKNALLSDVVFGDKIIFDEENRIAGIVPNLERKFLNPDSSFWAYFEIYPKNFTDSLKLYWSIIDADDHIVHQKTAWFLPEKSIISYLLDLSRYVKTSGRYSLILRAYQKKRKAAKQFRFSANWQNSPYTKINIDLAIKTLREFIPTKDYKFLMRAPDSVKEEYFKKFWKQRDPTPGTERNELLDEFYRRVNFANEYFSVNALNKEGWQTDRGAIYIKYGPPTEVERHVDEINLPPYEIWYYENLKRRFIFEDRSGLGDYKLVRME